MKLPADSLVLVVRGWCGGELERAVVLCVVCCVLCAVCVLFVCRVVCLGVLVTMLRQ